MLLAVRDLGIAACSPGLEVSLPFLLEVATMSSAFVLCMFHGPQYVSSVASLPGGVKYAGYLSKGVRHATYKIGGHNG